MSVERITWAWTVDCGSAAQKLVLVALADHADVNGYCYPSAGRLAERTGISDRQVRRHLTDLCDNGLIQKVRRRRRKDGNLSTWLYHLGTLTAPHEPEDIYDQRTPASGSDRTSASGGVADISVRAEPSVLNRQSEPSGSVATVVDDSPPEAVALIEPYERAVPGLCEELAASIERRGNKRPTVTKAWLKDMRGLVVIDGRDPRDITRVIRWLETGRDDIATFWAPNVRSPKKLREKWDQMREQHQRSTQPARKTSAGMEALRRIHNRATEVDQ